MNKRLFALGVTLVVIGILLIFPYSYVSQSYPHFASANISVMAKIDTASLNSTGRNEYIVELVTPSGIQALEEQNNLISVLESYGGEVKARYSVVNALNVELDSQYLVNIANLPYVKRIYLNRNVARIFPFEVSDKNGTELENIFEGNYTGKGVVIAVVDTGINPDLDIFDGKVIDTFTISGYDYVHWHGNAVASIIVSIAPDVSLINVMVFQSDGSAYLADILQGLDFIQRWHRSHLDVPLIVSNSWGISQANWHCGGWQSPCIMCEAINSLTKQGIAVVNAGGNEGAIHDAINCPGQAYYALCVASVNKDFEWSYFSSVGPTTDGNKKPDVAEIGENVVVIDTSGNERVVSGTSFATPVVSALLALLMEKYGTKLSIMDYYNIIRQNTIDVEEQGYDYKTGYGVPNANVDLYVVEINIDVVRMYTGSGFIFVGLLCVGVAYGKRKV